MEDLKASLLAVAFGAFAVGAFWLARPLGPKATLRVVDQWTPDARTTADKDAAVAFRVDYASVERLAREQDQTVEYRIVDRQGHGYPLVTMSDSPSAGVFKLQRGYNRRIDAPRLAAFVGDRIVAAAPIRALPAPENETLVPTPDPGFRIVFHKGAGPIVQPDEDFPKDERWRIVANRSSHAASLDAWCDLSLDGDSRHGPRLPIPFGDESPLVEAQVVRYRVEKRSEVVRVDGLRLVQRFGGTAMVVDRPMRVRSRFGGRIFVPQQDNGPKRPIRRADPRLAQVSLSVGSPWAEVLDYGPPGDVRRDRVPEVQVLRPLPESLGLNVLGIGGGRLVAKRTPKGPVRTGPFVATIRITYDYPVEIERRSVVVPIEIGREIRFQAFEPFDRRQRAAPAVYR